MKKTTRFILFNLIFSTMLLSACSGAQSPSVRDDSNTKGPSVTPVVVDDNGNSSNSNDVNSNDSGVEIFGVVEAITDDTITINGVTYLLPAGITEFKDLVSVGDQVKVQVIFNADGTFTILEVEISTGDDNGNDANSNDDNGNDANSNDDNGNGSNSNDDNGGNDNGSGGGNDDSGGGNDNDGNDDGGGGNDNDGDSNDNG